MRLLIAVPAICGLLVCTNGCALPPAPADPQAMNLPIYKPVVNGRLVTVTVLSVNGAKLPAKCAERAAAWLDRYVAGDVRLVHGEPLTLSADTNGAISQGQIRQHRMSSKGRGVSDITVYVVPLFNDCDNRGFAARLPDTPGH